MKIETAKITYWHDDAKGFYQMPAGTSGIVLTKIAHERLVWREKFALRMARAHYKRRGVRGLFALLQGKYRWLNEGSFSQIN